MQLLSAGSTELDIQGLAELGITVANTGGANAIPVAEHAIALLLSVSRCSASSNGRRALVPSPPMLTRGRCCRQ